jgi:transcription antitermination factor NusG
MTPLRRWSSEALDWFAVQVWAGRELTSAKHLRARACDVFLPCYRAHKRWSDRVKKVDCPLFPGYVFCRIGPEALGKIITAPGVIRIVGDELGPLSIPPGEIEAIQRLVETALAVEPWPFMRVGQRVRIEAGPLREMEGVILSTKSRHRLVVSITLLQRSVAVELDPEWVSVPAAVFLPEALQPSSQARS